ncbi:hypothetical protein [Cupriavidus basilensis]|uniref:hypothetical protein n=1 Tax=Cupriavidus basilensis TaxID=68895 RepID=UPI0020A6C6AC|nr:hypothetical protein [Cupriavidus basilensis]MCP3017522.1 hypothetical protein [Cupriavidus basilensis]
MGDSFHRADWLSFSQALGTVLAIIGAFVAVIWQAKAQRRRDRDTENERRDLSLLSIQALAAEVAQMCTLSGAQKEGAVPRQIYPSIPDEFAAMAKRFNRFPLDRAVECGKVEEILELRRLCLEMELIHRSDIGLAGNIFTSKHRTTVSAVTERAMRISLDLDKEIEARAPGKYTDRIRRHL